MQSGLFLHGGGVLFQLRGGGCAVPDCRDNLAKVLPADIARRIDPRTAGSARIIRQDIALRVGVHQLPDKRGLRLVPGKDENTEAFLRGKNSLLSGLGIAATQDARETVPRDRHHLGVRQHGNPGMLAGRLCGSRRAGEVRAPDKNRDVGGIARQEHALLRRRKAAADHKDRLAGKEFTVTGRAVRDAPPAEIVLAGKTDPAGVRAGGNQNTEAGKVPLVGMHRADVAVSLQSRDRCQAEFRTEALRLAAHGIGQGTPGCLDDTGVVDKVQRGRLQIHVNFSVWTSLD